MEASEFRAWRTRRGWPFRYAPNAIDPVLVELVATIRFLTISEDIRRLEAEIAEELC
jgi:hypothetical protein